MKPLPFNKIFDDLKNRIIENNLTFEEVAENSGISVELLEILLNPDSDVVDSISRLFAFTKINLHSKRILLKIHTIAYNKNKTQLRIKRVVEPKCSMFFDKATQEFYKFSMTNKRLKISETHKQLLMSDMKGFLEKTL